MAIDFEIRGINVLLLRLSGLASGFSSKSLMTEIGSFIRFSILRRTAAGKDVDTTPFEPYSERYAIVRRMAGRPVNKVDLFFTGSMLSSITMDAGTQAVRVYFASTQDRFGMDNPLKAIYNQFTRKFFGINEDDAEKITRMAEKAVRAKLRGKRFP